MIYRIKNFFEYLPRRIKWSVQKLFRKTHTSDYEVWELYPVMAEWILPRLYEFKKYPRMGYPSTFSEYSENEWKSREEYDQAIAEGKMKGGGSEAWEEVLDKIIFAFEFALADGGKKKYEKPFMKKHGDWHAEIPENLQQMKWYRSKKDGHTMTPGSHPNDKPVDLDEYELEEDHILSRPFYYNMKMHQEFAERAQEGFKLFGEHFQSFWD